MTAVLKSEAPARSEAMLWRTRPLLSVAVRLVAAFIPVAVSLVVTYLASRVVSRPQQFADALLWWAIMLGLATVVVFSIERLTRRLAPLAALLKLSLVFPDRAPSRFSVALRSGTSRQLQERYETVKRDGLGGTPAEAARKVVELIGTLNAHDHATRGHCERVRAYTALIAEELNLPADEVDKLRWAGLLHDLGKLDVPKEILNKKGKLDADEWTLIKTHPAAGARIAAPLAGWLGDSFRAIAEHHERWDGAGYPMGLAGEDIAIGARIVAVADAFDVMTAARSYKPPHAPSWARRELVRCAGSQFDPEIVRAFLNVSLGRLRWTMGPISWLAQLPLLAQAPIASAAGSLATTAMAATVAVGATAKGVQPVSAESVPATTTIASTTGQSDQVVVTDPPGTTVIVITTTTLGSPPIPTTHRGTTPPHTVTTTIAPPDTPSAVTTPPTTDSPKPTPPSKPATTPKPTPAPKTTPAPKPTAPPKTTTAPKPTATPAPPATPKPTQAPKPTAAQRP
jgi:putative nucleotidyltransferase with HDIG domain